MFRRQQSDRPTVAGTGLPSAYSRSGLIPMGRQSRGEQELAHRLLGFKIAMRRRGVFERVGPVDQHVQGAFLDPPHHLQRALTPLIDRLLRIAGER